MQFIMYGEKMQFTITQQCTYALITECQVIDLVPIMDKDRSNIQEGFIRKDK